MSMRISSTLPAILALAACSAAEDTRPKGEAIACAVGGSAKFDGVCFVERTLVPGGSTVVVRHPDGAFRRFEVEGDQVRTADGAGLAETTVLADFTEVKVGDDFYRFPTPGKPANQ